jgi:hypothetical protein
VKSKRRYYVYALVDPRDGKPFYYGKGTRGRSRQHLADHKAGRISNAAKHAAIDKILASGHDVKICILHRNLTECEALRIESELISEAKATRFITNGMPWFRSPPSELQQLYEAQEMVGSQLDWMPTRETYFAYIKKHQHRDPTRSDWGVWILHLSRLAGLRRTIRNALEKTATTR